MDVGSYSTGFRQLDQQLDQGYPAGSVVTLVAPAYSSGELIVEEFALDEDHQTVYVAAPDEAITSPRIREEAGDETHVVRSYGDLPAGLSSALSPSRETSNGSGPPVEADGEMEGPRRVAIDRPSIVVDTANALIDAAEDLTLELTGLRRLVEAEQGVCLVHLQSHLEDLSAPERLLLKASDGVLCYDHDPKSPEPDNLMISEFRGVSIPEMQLRLEFVRGTLAVNADREF